MERLALSGTVGNRGKRQIRGDNIGRVVEGWKRPLTLNEDDGEASIIGMGETQSEISFRNPESCAVNRSREGASLEAQIAHALRILAGDRATPGAQSMSE